MSKETDPALYESKFERQEGDRYFTEHWVTAALLRAWPALYDQPVIWDCAAGRGDILHVCRDHGFETIGSDVDMSEFGALGMGIEGDFFEAKTSPTGCKAIITNPPYEKKLPEKFVRHALSLDGVDIICMLLRSEFQNAGGRTDLFEDAPFAAEVVLTSRPRWDWWFRDKPIASPRHNFSWFIWDWGFTGSNPALIFEGKKPKVRDDDPGK